MALAAITDLYDQVASSYHRLWLPVIEPAAVRLLDSIAPAVEARPDGIIVDVGAGTGALSRAALARWPGVRVIGVDPSHGMIELGRAAVRGSLDPTAVARMTWLTGVAEHLPIDSASVDAIVSSFAWQYVRARAPVYREARRVLRPGGVLAVVTWLVNDLSFSPWRQLSEVFGDMGVARPPAPRVAGPFRSVPSAAAALRRAGFRDVRAVAGLVEYQWTREALIRCTLEEEEHEALAHVDAATLRRVEERWRERLDELDEPDLCYRDAVAYVTGRSRG